MLSQVRGAGFQYRRVLPRVPEHDVTAVTEQRPDTPRTVRARRAAGVVVIDGKTTVVLEPTAPTDGTGTPLGRL